MNIRRASIVGLISLLALVGCESSTKPETSAPTTNTVAPPSTQAVVPTTEATTTTEAPVSEIVTFTSAGGQSPKQVIRGGDYQVDVQYGECNLSNLWLHGDDYSNMHTLPDTTQTSYLNNLEGGDVWIELGVYGDACSVTVTLTHL